MMKKLLLAACLLSAATGAMAQNIDIHLGGSGYYGRIDLGNLSRPPVLYQEPMYVQRPTNYRTLEPMYLRVPPGHAKKWSKHCSRYNACGQPVYFVQDSWYNNTYAPSYRKSHGGRDRDNGRVYQLNDNRDDRDAYRDNDKHDKRDKHDKHDKKDKHGGDDDHGKGHGKGKH